MLIGCMKNTTVLFILMSLQSCGLFEPKWVNPCISEFDKSKEFVLPYVAPSKRKAAIIEAFQKLKFGMSKAEVAAIIGEPDLSHNAARKEGSAEESFLFTEWEYLIVKTDQAEDHPSIKLSVYFGRDCKLYVINAQSIKEIGKEMRR